MRVSELQRESILFKIVISLLVVLKKWFAGKGGLQYIGIETENHAVFGSTSKQSFRRSNW